MKTLLAIEWLKIKRYRTFWILMGFFFVLLPLWNYQVFKGMIKFGGSGMNFLSQAYSFPEIWGNMGFWASIFIIFLSILIIILTTNEFTFRTHRQNVIDGWDRLQFYHAKVLLVLLLSIAATVYVLVTGTIFGLMNGGASAMFMQIEKLAYFFLLSINYLGFALLIGLLIRRSGLAIGLFMLYCMIVEPIISGILNWGFHTNLGNYLPLQSSDELLPFPLFGMAKSVMQMATVPAQYYILATLAWCAVYYFAGRRLILRSDW